MNLHYFDFVKNPTIELNKQEYGEELVINHPRVVCTKCHHKLVFVSYEEDYDGYGRCGWWETHRCAFKNCSHKETIHIS